jgi:hypothetical protein
MKLRPDRIGQRIGLLKVEEETKLFSVNWI